MNRREWDLLDKQLSGVHPHAPIDNGALSLAFIAVFLGGLFLGGWMFAHKGNQMQTSDEQMIALFHVNGTPPTMR